MPPRQGVIAALPNTQKQTQGGFQNKETKKHGPNERTDQTPEKELNKMAGSNLSDAEFKTLVIQMFSELSEDLNSIKKIQSKTKNTLVQITNNLQGNSRVDEAENQINDLEHKEAKTNHAEQQEEKRIQKKKKMRIIQAVSGTTPRGPTFASQGCQKEKRKSKKLEIYLKK